MLRFVPYPTFFLLKGLARAFFVKWIASVAVIYVKYLFSFDLCLPTFFTFTHFLSLSVSYRIFRIQTLIKKSGMIFILTPSFALFKVVKIYHISMYVYSFSNVSMLYICIRSPYHTNVLTRVNSILQLNYIHYTYVRMYMNMNTSFRTGRVRLEFFQPFFNLVSI